MEVISAKDRDILRETAKKQLEYAKSPAMREKIKQWYAHNDLKGGAPTIQIEMWTFEKEIIPPRLRCESEPAREIERHLYRQFLNHELFDDDYPVPDHFPIGWSTWFKLFGLTVEREHATNSDGDDLGHRFKYPITDLEVDLPKLKPTEYGVDKEATFAKKAYLEELFGDILPVRISGGCLYACPTQDVVHFMGLENMMMAMYDCPDEFHALMDRITDDYVTYHQWLENEGLILPSNARNHVGQGTWGFTRDLPGPEYNDFVSYDFGEGKKSLTPVTANTSWGYMDSQESVGISPDMYGEFVYPYYKKIASRYGLFSYGCCEPVHPVWEKYISAFPNLRKVSISPWCDEEYMGEHLKGKKVIFQRKPSPNFVGVGSVFDEEGYTAHIVKTVKAARGCPLEFTMRDVYTIGNDIPKARRAIEIIRQSIDTYYY